MPVIIYGKIRLSSLTGELIIDGDIEKGMIGFGQSYEKSKASAGLTEINLEGKLIFKGYCQFGKDVFLYVGQNATCVFGNMSSVASKGKVICTNSVTLGNYARFGSECQIIDTNFHDMIYLDSDDKIPRTRPINIGDYNFGSNRVTIMKGTRTSSNTSIASNSLCTKDYTHWGSNILLGGIPARLLKRNIKRDWDNEYETLERNLKFKNIIRV